MALKKNISLRKKIQEKTQNFLPAVILVLLYLSEFDLTCFYVIF